MKLEAGNITAGLLEKLAKIREEPHRPYYFRLAEYKEVPGEISPNANHFILFLKPEALAIDPQIKIGSILQILESLLSTFAVDIGGVSLLSGSYLKKHRIIDRHYGVLNNISRNGDSSCSDLALARASQEFGDLSQVRIMGGHQLLEYCPELTPYGLCVLNDNMGTKKLGSGTYGVKINLFDEIILLLNGFHPYQLGSLTELGKGILAIECRSHTSWHVLRTSMVGGIRPDKAHQGSFRRELFEQRQLLGIKNINVAHNYIHISPGPLEAMMQVVHFFSNYEEGESFHWRNTDFGQCIANVADEKVAWLERNPEILFGENLVPIFDKTEDMDAYSCLNLVQEVVARQVSSQSVL